MVSIFIETVNLGKSTSNPVRTADGEDSWIMNIRNDEGKLSTCMPSFWGLLWLRIVEVYRNCVIGRCIGISEGK